MTKRTTETERHARAAAKREARLAKLRAATEATLPPAIEAAAEPAEQPAPEPVVDTLVSRSVVAKRWQREYAHRPLKNTCSDELAYNLKAACQREDGTIDLERVRAIGARNGIDVATRWGHLNPGMQRMNLGNCLRAKAKAGEEINV